MECCDLRVFTFGFAQIVCSSIGSPDNLLRLFLRILLFLRGGGKFDLAYNLRKNRFYFRPGNSLKNKVIRLLPQAKLRPQNKNNRNNRKQPARLKITLKDSLGTQRLFLGCGLVCRRKFCHAFYFSHFSLLVVRNQS